MKNRFIVLMSCLLGSGMALIAQKPAAKKAPMPESKYFNFQSHPELNAHLFLYNKAMAAKFKKTPNDSMVHLALKDKAKSISAREQSVLNAVLVFYRDSLLNRDVLFDSLMRDFSDKLVTGTGEMVKWQIKAQEAVKTFDPYFRKLVWSEIELSNNKWLKTSIAQIVKLESQVIPELERIYQNKLPAEKIRVDLVDYATWAGAFSFNDRFCHIILSSSHHSNQGDLAAEVLFHESSHFLVDKLEKLIATEAKGKDLKTSINLWHNMIFYTTGYVLRKELAKNGKVFVPYYEQMKFAEKFPDFKQSVEAAKQFWDAYCENSISMEEAVKKIVGAMNEKK